jgi:hypothetical protein
MFVLFAVLFTAIVAAPAAQASQLGDVMTRSEMGALADKPIKNFKSQKCLVIANSSPNNGAPAQLGDCNGQPGSVWRQQWLSEITFWLVNGNGKCLVVKDASREDGAPVQQGDCTEQMGAYWMANYNPSGYVRISNFMSKCLDIKDPATQNGNLAQQWRCTDRDSQFWNIPII